MVVVGVQGGSLLSMWVGVGWGGGGVGLGFDDNGAWSLGVGWETS